MNIDLTFPHEYDLEALNELPNAADIDRFYYPGASRVGGRDGKIIMFRPMSGTPWVGVFAPGYEEPPSISIIAASPDPLTVCVVSGGAAIFVNVLRPAVWLKAECFPVLDVRIVAVSRAILFCDFTRLAMYNQDGKQWRTPPICSDKLKITEISHGRIIGVGWSASRGIFEEFQVNLISGAVIKSCHGTAKVN